MTMKFVFHKSATERAAAPRTGRARRATPHFFRQRLGILLLSLGALGFIYFRFNRMIDERLAGNLYLSPSQVFSAPKPIAVGQVLSAAEVANYLQGAGYSERAVAGGTGVYRLSRAGVEVRPSPLSYFAGTNAIRVDFAGRRIVRIRDLVTGSIRPAVPAVLEVYSQPGDIVSESPIFHGKKKSLTEF
jgi:hypothetical protein